MFFQLSWLGALVALGMGEQKAGIFVVAMLVGMGLFELLERVEGLAPAPDQDPQRRRHRHDRQADHQRHLGDGGRPARLGVAGGHPRTHPPPAPGKPAAVIERGVRRNNVPLLAHR